MDRSYWVALGWRVGLALIDALKSAPVGHPFYGNQWDGGSTGRFINGEGNTKEEIIKSFCKNNNISEEKIRIIDEVKTDS